MVIRLKSDILTEFDLKELSLNIQMIGLLKSMWKSSNAIVVNALDVDRSHQQRSANNTEYLSAGLG